MKMKNLFYLLTLFAVETKDIPSSSQEQKLCVIDLKFDNNIITNSKLNNFVSERIKNNFLKIIKEVFKQSGLNFPPGFDIESILNNAITATASSGSDKNQPSNLDDLMKQEKERFLSNSIAIQAMFFVITLQLLNNNKINEHLKKTYELFFTLSVNMMLIMFRNNMSNTEQNSNNQIFGNIKSEDMLNMNNDMQKVIRLIRTELNNLISELKKNEKKMLLNTKNILGVHLNNTPLDKACVIINGKLYSFDMILELIMKNISNDQWMMMFIQFIMPFMDGIK
ncbi:hypothetical protein AB836_00165 [Rickettsiales bacterium (ex Bugula neritina AB1)]|nr:hypothetical protein AB836_00165 [Rickettsiales bacterium (ex Bugula neritina AB1)]